MLCFVLFIWREWYIISEPFRSNRITKKKPNQGELNNLTIYHLAFSKLTLLVVDNHFIDTWKLCTLLKMILRECPSKVISKEFPFCHDFLNYFIYDTNFTKQPKFIIILNFAKLRCCLSVMFLCESWSIQN